jgi:hypothetical protein
VIGVSRSNLIERMRERAKKRIGLYVVRAFRTVGLAI